MLHLQPQIGIYCNKYTKKPEEPLRSTPLSVILTLRSDFYGMLQDSVLGQFLPLHQVNVQGVLDEDDLRTVIEGPAAQVGLQLEAGLVDLLLTDLQETKNPLPLLEFTLEQLWERAHGENLLTRQVYLDPGFGRVTGAISQWATKTYMQLSNDTERALTRRIFTRLIRYGVADRPDTRQPLPLDEVVKIGDDAGLVRSLIQRLADARLLVTDGNTVEIIHDALITEWGDLRGWIKQQRPFLSWREGRLREKLLEWKEKAKAEKNLLYEADLSDAELKLKDFRQELTAEECGYIEASVRRRDRLRQKELRQIWGIAIGSLTATVLVSLAATFAFLQAREANTQRIEAEKQKTEAQLIALTLSSESLFKSNKELEALIEGIKAGIKLKDAHEVSSESSIKVTSTLQQILADIKEKNILEHKESTSTVNWIQGVRQKC